MRLSRIAAAMGVMAGVVCAWPALEAGDTGGGALVGQTVDQQPFGTTPDGQPAHLFTVTNASGMEFRFSDFGGIIHSITVPDRDGTVENVVLSHDTLEEYRGSFSTLIGRYANRIAGARFTLDGQEYPLAANNGPNHLHGGPSGFQRRLWSAEPFENQNDAGAVLRYTSVDGEEGYPGTLEVQVTYTLTNADEVVIHYRAVTDAPTHVNLSHHAYFNLTGDPGDIFGHELTVYASRYTPVDSTLIPTGELASVANTPFDFREPTLIGARVDADHPQIGFGGGYDHNWVLDHQGEESPSLAARLRSPASGRVLEVLTTQPGLQIYTGLRTGVALETQHFPDSPNQPDFPSTVLRPEEEYQETTVFRFLVDG